VVVPRVGFIRQFRAVASIVVGLFPLAGLPVGIIAYLVNRESPGWTRIASKIGLGLSLAWILVVILFAILAPKGS
jgi:hypothetical protein